MTEKRDKVNVDDIVGLIKTDEHTDSVTLKKEAQLSICEKRLIELEKENEQLKTQLQNTSDQRDEFFRGATENAKMNGKLKKQIDALHEENQRLKGRIMEYEEQIPTEPTPSQDPIPYEEKC